jgi:hypothetical protein
MIESQDVFSYIKSEEANWRTARLPLTNSKDWNMYEHIQRCTNAANGWFHRGANDGIRPYNDVITPIINVAFRLEGFDVKDIVPFVNDSVHYYKSFLVKKYHPQWARKNQLDTFIDEVVESSIIYDLVLIKDINNVRPEVVDLKTLAFCDQADIMAGPICIKHNYTPAELMEFSGKWDKEAIKLAITTAGENKKIAIAEDQTVKSPNKYIEVYELRGSLPDTWLKADGEMYSYTPQTHIVSFYTDNAGNSQGIVFYKGKDKPLAEGFKALKIDQVRSKGRACGRSIVETLFEPQVWNNYAGIKIKALLDSAVNVIITNSEELGNQKLSELPLNTILKQERDATTTRLDGTLQNLPQFTAYQQSQESQARVIGSASEGSLGVNPTSGTPFALQSLIVQEGQGIHEYRQGKIATFFADVLYPWKFTGYLVKEMNAGKKFSEDLSLDELQEIVDQIVTNEINQDIIEIVLRGEDITQEQIDLLTQVKREAFMKKGSRRFFETLKGELDEVPVDVMFNIKGKQRKMAENADKITNVIRQILANPGAIAQVPGVGKAFNELLEESGMSPIDFSSITQAPAMMPNEQPQEQPPLSIA